MFQGKNLEVFREELFYSGKLNPNSYYAILVKVRKGDNYYTVGKKQHIFIFKDKIDKKIIGPKNKTQIKIHISNEMRIKS